jgi:hypothetical protein
MKNKNLLLTTIVSLGLAAVTMAQTVPSYVPTNGLIGWWPFSGNANDESGNGNNGIVNGPILSTDRFGNPNSSYALNKANYEYINVTQNNALNILSNITISLWTYINSSGPYNQYVNKTDPSGSPSGIQFVFSSNSQGVYFYFGSSPQFFQTNTTVSLGSWHNLCVTYNYDGSPTNSKCFFYVDGICTDSFPTTINLSPSNYDLKFGSYANSSMNTVDGQIDDICIWNRALTPQEIADLYNSCQLLVNTQPTNQSINLNNNAQFVSGSSDSSATYQWQTDFGVGFQDLNSVGQYSGTTDDTLIVSNVMMSNNNQLFRCIVNSGLCSDTSNIAVLTINNNVGSNESSQHDLFSVFPNPAQSLIILRSDISLIGKSFSIVDIIGRIVLNGRIVSENTQIDLNTLVEGTYILKVDESFSHSFCVTKNH